MCDSELNGLEMISEAATGLPAPIKKGFLKAMMDMLGGLSNIPAAWVRRSTQGIDDTTKGRSLVASELAKAVAKEATQDPEILQAAAEVYLPDKLRKTKNRIHVAQRAADYVSGMTEDGANASAPDEDWMNLFSRFAEDATSERLQDMFGRVLAGEVVHPGSFNLRTLRAISEMDQQTAQDFNQMWARSVGKAVNYNRDFQLGDWYSRWQRLTEVGLMAPSQSYQHLPQQPLVQDGFGFWSPISAAGVTLSVKYPLNSQAKWAHIAFTRVGTQIGSILAPPDYTVNIREVGLSLANQGVARIELHTPGAQVEVLFPEPTG